MPTPVDISLLSFDVSHNCLGRAHTLAEVLSRRFAVEIVGPATDAKGVWFPCRASEIPIHWIPQGRVAGRKTFNDILSLAQGRVLYAIKPRLTSFGAGLLGRSRQHKPLVVDIDDWELGFYLANLGPSLKQDLRHPGNPNNLVSTWLMEKLVSRADAITTSNDLFMHRFGGIKIPHVRDTAVLDPRRFNREAIRHEHGWTDSVVAVFLGTPAPHKGIDILIEAAKLVRTSNFRLVIVGVPEESPLWLQAEESGLEPGDPLELMGPVPLDEVPRLLAGADICVAPQLAGPATAGQSPAKIIDAMAMATPIVASAVSDIPEMIEGCGLLCAPGDVLDLAAKLTVLAEDPLLREVLGAEARRRCIKYYSYDSAEGPLAALFERVGCFAAGGLYQNDGRR